MDRRVLLKGALGLGAVGGSGCATLLSNPGAVTGSSLPDFLATLDAARDSLLTRPIFPGLRDPQRPDHDAQVREREELVRKTFRSLVLVGSVQELPREQLAHPEVQRRLSESMGEFDDAMFGITKYLEDLPGDERAKLGQALRDDPDAGMQIAGDIDREAAALGVSMGVRHKLRGLSMHASSRLRQAPQLTLDDLTGKVRKLERWHGAQAEVERAMSASAATAMVWGAEAVDEAAGGVQPRAFQSCAVDADCREGEICANFRELESGEWSRGECRVPRHRYAGRGAISVGGVLLGLGLATGAAAGITLAVGGGIGWAFALTVGGVLAVAGLITLIVGMVIAANSRHELVP
ncbi:MAG: hypothetical protein U0228_14905 [Myxococcaceae bacterium]